MNMKQTATNVQPQTKEAPDDLARLMRMPANLERAEQIAAACSPTKLAVLSNLQRSMVLCRAIREIHEMMDDRIMGEIMSLMNSRLGFLCDKPSYKDSKPYDMETVRRCAIEALLNGLYMSGNEWNIISGNMYVTKEGLSRKVSEFPGLTDLRLTFQPPATKETRDGKPIGAIVECSAEWRIDGNAMRTTETIPIRMNAGMGADAVLGKAERKLLARVLRVISGSTLSLADGEVGDPPLVEERKAAAAPLNKLLQQSEKAPEPDPAAGEPDIHEQIVIALMDRGMTADEAEDLIVHRTHGAGLAALDHGAQLVILAEAKAGKL